MVKVLLHLEGFAVLVAALYLYYLVSGNWLLFVILLFTPDISMIGYLKNKKVGAIFYNLFHNFATAFIVISLGIFTENNLAVSLGAILLAHVGLDRALGFGLKYPTVFKDTHLQRV